MFSTWGGNRTHTNITVQLVLSQSCLPIPPPEYLVFYHTKINQKLETINLYKQKKVTISCNLNSIRWFSISVYSCLSKTRKVTIPLSHNDVNWLSCTRRLMLLNDFITLLFFIYNKYSYNYEIIKYLLTTVKFLNNK